MARWSGALRLVGAAAAGVQTVVTRWLRLGVLGLLSVGADCDVGGQGADPVVFDALVVDPGPVQSTQTITRGHGPITPTQTPESALWYLQLEAPVDLEATTSVRRLDGGTSPLLPPTTIFLEGADFGVDRAANAESNGAWGQILHGGAYDVFVAPDTLLGQRAAHLLEDQDLSASGEVIWELPEPEVVTGVVVDDGGAPVEGMVVSVFRASEPRLPVGITARSAADGTFGFAVPAGRYDVICAGPADGTLPLPPLRVIGQQLPLLPGVDLYLEVPRVIVRTVRGQLVLPSGAGVQGRVQVSGWVSPPTPGGAFAGGLWRAEIETNAGGDFELRVPVGRYTFHARPRLPSRYLQAAEAERVIDDGDLNDLRLAFTDAPPVSVSVFDPDGEPYGGARLEVAARDGGGLAFAQVLAADGLWLDRLSPGPYRLTVIPPVNSETGRSPFPRRVVDWDVPEGGGALDITLREPAQVDGFVYTEGRVGAADVRVVLRDPLTGEIWDDVLSRRDENRGAFQATLPAQ